MQLSKNIYFIYAHFAFFNKYLTLILIQTVLLVKCWFLFLNNYPDTENKLPPAGKSFQMQEKD